MTFWLIETCLVNSLVACLMALVIWCIGRVWRRPALLHALWVLVLLKMVTPPLLEMPVGFRLEPLARQLPAMSTTIELNTYNCPAPSAEHPPAAAPAAIDTPPVAAGSRERMSGVGCETNSSPAAGTIDQEGLDRRIASAAGVLSAESPSPTISFGTLAFVVLLTLWAIGSLAWFLVIGWRLLKFSRFLTYARPASAEIEELVRRLSAALGMRRAPACQVINARFSPMLWAGFGRARILLPRELLQRIEPTALETLLLHELAHYHRRDHWVRLLEVAVTGLFWWHPVVWLARGELEASEEHCCDAWVVEHFAAQPRRYAEALLETIDFLSESPTMCLAPAASSLGEARFLRQRITRIFTGVAPKSLTRVTRCLVVALAICLLALGPRLFAAAAYSTLEVVAREVPPAPEPVAQLPEPSESIPPTVESANKQTTAISSVKSAYEPPVATPYIADVNVWASARSIDQRFELTARTDGSSRLIDRELDQPYDLTHYNIAAAAFSPAGTRLAVASTEGQLSLIDCLSGDRLAEYALPGDEISTIAFSPAGKQVAVGTNEGTVQLLHAESLTLVEEVTSLGAAVNSVRFSPDATRLAIASGSWMSPDEGRLVVWNLHDRRLEIPLATGVAQASVVFMENSQLLATDWDGTAVLYDMANARPLRRLQLDKNLVSLAAFAPSNDQPLVTAAEAASQPPIIRSPFTFY